MKLNRSAFTQHLNRISCGGQISEVVFVDGFSTMALSEDHLLCVMAPAIPRTESLDGEVGVPDLGLLIKSLGVLAGTGNDATNVELSFEGKRLIIDEEERGKIRLMTATPSTIGTRVKDETAKKLRDKAPSENGIPLVKSVIDGITSTFSLLKAQELEIEIGEDGGKVTVGNENAHMAEFRIEDMKVEEDYSLLFGSHFVDVLKIITNYAEAEIFFSGPKSFVTIRDGSFRYLLSPRIRGEE